MGLRLNLHRTVAFAFFLAAGAAPVTAETSGANDVLSPLVATPIASPNPVLMTDDKVHLVYEVVLMNMAGGDITIKKVETLDAANGTVIGTLEGDSLAKQLRLNGGGKETALSGGGSGTVFMDVTLPKDATIPKALQHRFDIEVAKETGGDRDGDRDPAPEHPQEIAVTGDPLPVGPGAVVIAPPLKGPRWVIGGGCCAPPSYHRSATLPINGALRVAERFAIDFVQLNDKDALADGPPDQLTSYAFFGDEILSVADGTVVAAEDGQPEQVPGKLPDDATIRTAAGNHVVVDIGGGRFAFYAHMQPGSLKVKPGDRVKTGQVLGLLGNTGNTDAPHLHFHVMDGPSPLLSNGLPYVFTGFSVEGRVTDEEPLFKGSPVTIEKTALSGPFKDQLPLNDQVVDFP
ncbi:MAG TPA: M23 family metallopeptidase [Methyloceanibacter sp.]|nr:M23 family metallopeptidase [Methyloceanibacter sp.]